MADNAVQKKPGFIAKSKKFFKDVKGERSALSVVWPDKKHAMNNTGIVLGVMAVSAVFIGGLDIITSYLIKFFLSLL